MSENKDVSQNITIESIKQMGKANAASNVATRIKQCVMIIGVVIVTIFACTYFNEPKYLWLLLLLLLAF